MIFLCSNKMVTRTYSLFLPQQGVSKVVGAYFLVIIIIINSIILTSDICIVKGLSFLEI